MRRPITTPTVEVTSADFTYAAASATSAVFFSGVIRVGRLERDVGYAPWLEDASRKHLAKSLAGDHLAHLAAAVHIAAVFPAVAAVEQRRRHQRRLRRGGDAELALLDQAQTRLVGEFLAEARVQ